MGDYYKGKEIKHRLLIRVYCPPLQDFHRSVSHREPLQHLCGVASETVIFLSYKRKIKGMKVGEGMSMYGRPTINIYHHVVLCCLLGWAGGLLCCAKWWNLSPAAKNKLRKKTGIRKRKSKDKSPSPGMLAQTLAELCKVCTMLISCSLCKWCLLVSSVQVVKTHATGVYCPVAYLGCALKHLMITVAQIK